MKNCLAAFLLFLLAACAGTPFKWSDVQKLKEGMTQDEVKSVMGVPYSVATSGDKTIWTWSYANGMTGRTKAASLVFMNGKLLQPPELPYQD